MFTNLTYKKKTNLNRHHLKIQQHLFSKQ